jgi:hypothetical protein
MVTIPKLIEPLQIARAMVSPQKGDRRAGYPQRGCAYPQVYQHKLLINNDLQLDY